MIYRFPDGIFATPILFLSKKYLIYSSKAPI